MKWIEISEEIFTSNKERAEFIQKDGRCFGMNIEGLLYMYVDNGEKFILDIFDKDYQGVLWDHYLHESLIRFYLDRNDFMMIEDIAHWINASLDIWNFPFILEDIHYCDYDE